ncbi:MAG: hypothetical protein IKM59_04605 [Oscillospiraceae bacterium]|nr:hypothetical protein [Oscillospiraceae bacterium]
MRSIKTTVIILFLVIALSFSVMYCYDKLMVDHVPPRIIDDAVKLEISVNGTDEDLCRGLIATDDVDGDITDRIIVRRVSRLTGSNSAVAHYAVFDSASNFCTHTRNVYYTDYCQPKYSLTSPMIFNVNSVVTLIDRLSAYDVIDGDISSRIRISAANISTSVEGEYPMTLQVTNSTGDTSALTMTVQIRNYTSSHPVIHLKDYITYVEAGSVVDKEDFRDLILSVRDKAEGKAIDPSEVTITGQVDTSRLGSYDIKFSYINQESLSYSVILTVVVQ